MPPDLPASEIEIGTGKPSRKILILAMAGGLATGLAGLAVGLMLRSQPHDSPARDAAAHQLVAAEPPPPAAAAAPAVVPLLNPPIDGVNAMAPVFPRPDDPERQKIAPAVAESKQPLTTEDIVARCEQSVGHVKGKGGAGTGFLILDRVLATNAHVIDQELPEDLEVDFPSAPEAKNGPYTAQVLYFDHERDLALLRVDCDLPPLELAPNEPLRRGREITIIGNPGVGGSLTLENAVTSGRLSTRATIEGREYYQISASINPGNSGGPVLDPYARVIGMATLRATHEEGLGFCIPEPELRAAAERVRNQPASAVAEAASKHREYVVTHSERYITEALKSASPEQVLAILDAEKTIDPTDPAVGRIRIAMRAAQASYRIALDELATTTIRLKSLAASVGGACTCLEILEAAVEVVPPELRPQLNSDLFLGAGTAYLEARFDGGRSHRQAIDFVRARMEKELAMEIERIRRDGPEIDPNTARAGEEGLYGPTVRAWASREIHYTREENTPPRFGESETSVHIPRGSAVFLRRIRMKDGDKWRVATQNGKVIVVGAPFVSKHFSMR